MYTLVGFRTYVRMFVVFENVRLRTHGQACSIRTYVRCSHNVFVMGILFSTPEHQRLQWWNSPFPNPSVHQTIIIIIVAVIVVIPFLIHLFPLKLSLLT